MIAEEWPYWTCKHCGDTQDAVEVDTPPPKMGARLTCARCGEGYTVTHVHTLVEVAVVPDKENSTYHVKFHSHQYNPFKDSTMIVSTLRGPKDAAKIFIRSKWPEESDASKEAHIRVSTPSGEFEDFIINNRNAFLLESTKLESTADDTLQTAKVDPFEVDL
jgi:hypothetical protein